MDIQEDAMEMEGKGTTSAQNEHTPPPRSWRHYLPGFILFLNMSGYVMAHSVLNLYVPLSISRKMYPTRKVPVSKGSICIVNETKASPESEAIQKEAAMFTIYLSLVIGIPAVILNMLLGAFSDRFGRVFLFLTPVSGQFISKAILLFCIYYDLDINYILIGGVIEGASGGALAIVMASFAYIADVTEKNKQRSAAIAYLEIATGVGAVVGRLSTGYFIKATNYVWPQMTACCFLLLSIFIVIFLLPETMTLNTKKTITRASCMNYIRAIFSLYISKSNKGKRWKYNLCIMIFFTTAIITIGKPSVETLYQISHPFCWDSAEVGLYGSLVGLFQNVICMGMIRVLHLCLNDEGVAILGSVSGISGLVITAFATTDVMMYIAAITGGGTHLALPMIRAIMSRMTPPDKQGALFGGISGIEVACGLVGSLIFSAIYSHTVSFFRGTVFIVMAGSVLTSLLLLVVLAISSRQAPILSQTNIQEGVKQTDENVNEIESISEKL